MTDNIDDGTMGKAVFLDRDFQKFLGDNAEAAWLAYCEENGIDPSMGDDKKARDTLC